LSCSMTNIARGGAMEIGPSPGGSQVERHHFSPPTSRTRPSGKRRAKRPAQHRDLPTPFSGLTIRGVGGPHVAPNGRRGSLPGIGASLKTLDHTHSGVAEESRESVRQSASAVFEANPVENHNQNPQNLVRRTPFGLRSPDQLRGPVPATNARGPGRRGGQLHCRRQKQPFCRLPRSTAPDRFVQDHFPRPLCLKLQLR